MNNYVIVCEMENPSPHKFLITCEHASNLVPDDYLHLFTGAEEVLQTHRGWDPGATVIAHTIQRALHAPLISYPYSRLLIEPNRSLHHPRLFSEFSRQLSKSEKQDLVQHFYIPYRKEAERILSSIISHHMKVIHLSIHTFTPALNETDREFDIGLLYDPARTEEKEFSRRWKQSLQQAKPGLHVRMNQPYKGTSDGFTTFLRTRFGDSYLGIELEVNQQHFFNGGQHWIRICRMISDSLLYMQIKE